MRKPASAANGSGDSDVNPHATLINSKADEKKDN